MPKGPRGEKRPADAIARAVQVAKIATGEIDEPRDADGKNPHAKALGAKGGVARAKSLSAKKRSEIASKAARARYAKSE